MFADDNTALLSAHTLHELIVLANKEINNLLQYYFANKLTLHPHKTKAFIFKPPRTNLNLDTENGHSIIPLFLNLNNPNEHINSKIIRISLIPNPGESSARLLGVLIDENLNYKDHFKYLHGKVTKAVFSLRIMRHLLDQRHLKLLYNAYLKSSIEYGSILFTKVSKATMKPIIILQKKAIRIICNKGYRDHTAPLFKKEKIIPFENIIDYNICRFMYDYSTNNLPKEFVGTWQRNNEIHEHRVRNNNNFFIVNVNKNYLKDFPLFYFPKAWNTLPKNIKEQGSRNLFAKKLHTYIIDNKLWLTDRFFSFLNLTFNFTFYSIGDFY